MLQVTRKHSVKDNISAKKRLEVLESDCASIGAPMIIVDSNLLITCINDPALWALGYKRNEVVGEMTCADFLRTPLCGTKKCPLKQCFRTFNPVVGDTTVQTRDGRVFPVRAVCSPLLNKNCGVNGAMEIIIDQPEFVAAKWRSENIFASLSAPMFTVDPNLVATSINTAFKAGTVSYSGAWRW
jgi:PAS domain S-box-containing protein